MPPVPSPAPRPAALVTGGTLRFGRAIVQALARGGYAVAIHAGTSLAEAEALRDDIVGNGGTAGVIAADLAEHDSVMTLMPAAAAAVGTLTLLVNNACAFEPDEIGRLDRARFDRQFAVNLRAPVFLAQAFAAQAPSGGSIVNVLDRRISRPGPLLFSYGLSESAFHVATTKLAQALAPRLRVNTVAVGPAPPNAPREDDDFIHGSASEDVADAVLFLAQTNSITGETIAVTDGRHSDQPRGEALINR